MHPVPLANITFSHVKDSLLFEKKSIRSSLAWGSSAWRIALLPGTKINSPSYKQASNSAIVTYILTYARPSV